MPIQQYSLPASRIGTIKGRILKHAMPRIALGTVGINDDFKKRSGDTVIYRRWLLKGATVAQPNRFFQNGTGDRTQTYANQHLVGEGVTPQAENLTPQDISATVNEYAILYGYTNRTNDLYEDDVPKEMTRHTGERKGLVNEMVLFGVLKGCTNKYYGGAGTSRNTVNGVISLDRLRRICRNLDDNHATTITSMLKRGKAGMYGTSPIARCYPVWVHTDLKPDLRELPGYVPVEKYGDPSMAVDNEVGSCEEFRFIASPELVPIQDSGAAVAGTVPLLKSTSGTYADTYQVIIGSQDAWGHIGVDKDKMTPVHKPTGVVDSGDPLGQRGYVGCIWYYHAVILNNLQMAVYEVGTRALNS